MIAQIRESGVKKLLPKRKVHSHKGQNGRVLIVGGSRDYYGAPILAGLGALYSGADLVYLYVPECNFDVSRSLSPDFIVKAFKGDYLSKESFKEIVEFGKKKADSVLIGPGITDQEEVLEAISEILKGLHLPTVLDADAISVLKRIDKFPLEQPIVVTPHHNEFQNLVDREIVVKEEDTKSVIMLRSMSMDLHINMILKGPIDYVSSDEGVVEKNMTGNPGMTVGGSGDVLAGLVTTFLAQGLEGFDAARCAAYYLGKAGDYLEKKMGVYFAASDLAKALPYVLK